MKQYLINRYLNENALDQQFTETQKAQERLAIKSILEIKKNKIKTQRITLTTNLTSQKNKMTDFAGKTIVSNFKKGLTGKSADAAKKQLTSKIFEPNLKNPIK